MRPKLILFGVLLACSQLACDDKEPLSPVLDVRATNDNERPEDGDSSCQSSAELSVTADQVVYIVHALPTQTDRISEELELRVSTACTETTATHRHDEDGLVFVPLTMPEGAQCGAVVTATIANSITRCTLDGTNKAGEACSVACSESDESGDGDGDGTTDSTETSG